MASATAEFDIATALAESRSRDDDSAEVDPDPKRTAKVFGYMLVAMCLTPSCALVTCAANPDLAGDMVIRSE